MPILSTGQQLGGGLGTNLQQQTEAEIEEEKRRRRMGLSQLSPQAQSSPLVQGLFGGFSQGSLR